VHDVLTRLDPDDHDRWGATLWLFTPLDTEDGPTPADLLRSESAGLTAQQRNLTTDPHGVEETPPPSGTWPSPKRYSSESPLLGRCAGSSPRARMTSEPESCPVHTRGGVHLTDGAPYRGVASKLFRIAI